MRAPNIRIVVHEAELATVYAIRDEVFVEEQNVPKGEERDADDAHATHVLAFWGDRAVGTGRLVVKPDGLGKIGRMAVRKGARGCGVGRAIVATLIRSGEHFSLAEIVLDAQLQAIPFYARMGFVAEGEEFLDAGILHRRMRRRLADGG